MQRIPFEIYPGHTNNRDDNIKKGKPNKGDCLEKNKLTNIEQRINAYPMSL